MEKPVNGLSVFALTAGGARTLLNGRPMRRLSLCVSLVLAACGPNLASDGEGEPEELLSLAAALKQGRFGADPSGFVDEGVLHMYSTSGSGMNVPHLAASNPTDVSTLTAPKEALPDGQRGKGLTGGIWAPTVRRAGNHYAMWYSGEFTGAATKKCLWRAIADRPEGPFRRFGDGEAICPENWNIDPYLLRHPGGFWIYSKVGPHLQRRRLNDDGLSFQAGSSWDVVLSPGAQWEHGDGQATSIIENPAMVRLSKADGTQKWVLFYSGNSWPTKNYGVGYADCGNGTGPGDCVKKTTAAAWLNTATSGGTFGPGAASFFRYKDRDYMVIHGWENRCDKPADTCRTRDPACPAGREDIDCRFENPGGRSMYLYRVTLGDGGRPIARGL